MNVNLANLNYHEPVARSPDRAKTNLWLPGRRNYPQSPFVHRRTHARAHTHAHTHTHMLSSLYPVT